MNCIKNVLEVGCNIEANLYWLGKIIPPHYIYGVDINDKALSLARKELPCTSCAIILDPIDIEHA